jgi:hypothetical protein
VIGFVRIGSTSLALINKDKDVKGVLNGCEIFKISNFKDNIESATYVISDLIQSIHNKNKPECFSLYKDHWASEKYPMQEMLDQIVTNVRKNIKVAVKIRSKEASTNFESSLNISENINPKILNRNINVFSTKMSNASIILRNFIKYASIILEHKLGSDEDLWGASNIKKHMSDIKGKIASNNLKINKIDFYKEMMERTSFKLSLKLSSEAVMHNPEEKKVISQVLIPELINNYEDFKDLATSAIVILSPLIYVEDLFRKNTNYPANWFVSDDVLMNLSEDYTLLINFMQELPRIEANVIVPLDTYGSQILR